MRSFARLGSSVFINWFTSRMPGLCVCVMRSRRSVLLTLLESTFYFNSFFFVERSSLFHDTKKKTYERSKAASSSIGSLKATGASRDRARVVCFALRTDRVQCERLVSRDHSDSSTHTHTFIYIYLMLLYARELEFWSNENQSRAA